MSTMPGPASGLLDPGDFLGPLLRTLAESLDVREIFARIAAEARRIVPHDFLMLALITDDEQRVRLIALSGELPEGVSGAAVPEALRSSMGQSAIVLNDMQMQAGGRTLKGRLRSEDGPERIIEVEVQPLFRELVAVRGFRSFMRASVRLRGGVVGGMVFCSASPDAFPPAEVTRACPIADCVALALAHHSEEARDKLVAHAWPGNVRELRNAIERAVILWGGRPIPSGHLPLGVPPAPVKPAPPAPALD